MSLFLEERSLMKGNEAVAFGALAAGVEAYFAYPITPSTEVPETFSRQYGSPEWPDFRVFLQAPSEIEAIAMTIGSAATGAKSMTFTSSPGFSLKQEGISYAVAMEIPLVIGNVNRGGPGLGNIAVEQSDYRQTVHGGGHGGYRLIVLAPNSVQEILTFPSLAFDLAYQYRTPVVIMMDAFTGQIKEDICFPKIKKKSYDTSWALTGAKNRAPNILNSLHLEIEDMERVSQNLQKKWARISENEVRFEEWRCEDANIVIVAYGLSSRIAQEGAKELRKAEYKVGLLRPQTLWPFPARRLNELGKLGKKFIVAELNHGQMIDDVKAAMFGLDSVQICGFNRWGGKIFSVGEVVDAVRSVQ